MIRVVVTSPVVYGCMVGYYRICRRIIPVWQSIIYTGVPVRIGIIPVNIGKEGVIVIHCNSGPMPVEPSDP
jgi:hypothetical protein